MNHQLLAHLSDILQEEAIRYMPVSGGDISQAFLLETKDLRVFLKVEEGEHALEMFEAERSGLDAISATQTIRTPSIHHCGSFHNSALLLMEYIEAKQPDSTDFERLGSQLAALHQSGSEQFGWEKNNFIGRLPQQNTWTSDWLAFYVGQRLTPQFAMAKEKGLLSAKDIPQKETMLKSLDDVLKGISPSLIHGDLWSGNYLIAMNGDPYIIDPAVYYGHSEMDLAMSRLFGGFGNRFYTAYAESLPENPGTAERNEIYQLYYLLVHLNLFGASYRPAVMRTVKRYFPA